jgi:hypothetical protein
MGNKSQNLSRWQILLMAAVALMLCAGGCGDIFGEKTAVLQSDKIIREVSAIKTTPEPNIPKPEIYKQPPEIVEQVVAGKPDWKLFYFCKYHTSTNCLVCRFLTRRARQPPSLITPSAAALPPIN